MDELVKLSSETAIYYYYSTKHGYIFHREDGPAVEYTNGDESWMINNNYHRVDGPAKIRSGKYEWYLDGENMTFKEYLSRIDSEVAVEVALKYSTKSS